MLSGEKYGKIARKFRRNPTKVIVSERKSGSKSIIWASQFSHECLVELGQSLRVNSPLLWGPT
jgi:hypothetical protein